MANQQQIKSFIVKSISDYFINKIPFAYKNINNDTITVNTVDEFRKIVSDGQISNVSGSQDQQLVLYQQDYQFSNTNFDKNIDESIRCYCNGEVNVSVDGTEHTCPNDDYSENYTESAYSITHLTDGVDGDNNPIYITLYLNNTSQCGGVKSIQIDENILSILSQFIPFINKQINIDSTQAQQVLDTNIFELLPQQTTRQQLINKFFTDYSNLKGPVATSPPIFDDIDNDGIIETQDPTYDNVNDISSGGQYITRLTNNVNDDNTNQSLEWLRNDLNSFLEDVDQEGFDELDERPEYEDKSDGYLKIRHMNQAIIVRKEEGTDVGLMKEVTSSLPGGEYTGPSYLSEGFTITMWVKFLDKVNSGTLFNFGNPLRENNPMGFMLETFIVNKEDGTFTDGPDDKFLQGDAERFIRLVVRDENGNIRDSHFGALNRVRKDTVNSTSDKPALEWDTNNSLGYAFNYTRVPIDLTEWYFIVANYNPFVGEDNSGFDDPAVNDVPEYWQWNYDGTSYTPFSGLGSRCKVEIISKSDLIRARGFKSTN